MKFHIDKKIVIDAARYKWPLILQSLGGLGEHQTRNRHQPCPACSGTDRYRFDDKEGNGSYYCSNCGPGDGFSLLCKVNDWTFSEALRSVASYLGLAGNNIVAVDRNVILQKLDKEHAERTKLVAAIQTKAAALAQLIWDQAAREVTHSYLTAKRIKANGARVISVDVVRAMGVHLPGHWRGNLLVIAGRIDDQISTVSLINSSGDKYFLAGGKKRGAYFPMLGDTTQKGVICVAEGFATAASICEATGYPVAVAFDAGNLKPVCEALRAKFPELRIVVGADDDTQTKGNPGRTHAEAAARAVGGYVALPVFRGATV